MSKCGCASALQAELLVWLFAPRVNAVDRALGCLEPSREAWRTIPAHYIMDGRHLGGRRADRPPAAREL